MTNRRALPDASVESETTAAIGAPAKPRLITTSFFLALSKRAVAAAETRRRTHLEWQGGIFLSQDSPNNLSSWQFHHGTNSQCHGCPFPVRTAILRRGLFLAVCPGIPSRNSL
jgi:hypothetical protein